MVISWSADRYKKLFAAVLAAHPEIKLNYKEVAVYFGEGATYDSIECRMRDIKKHAKQLRAEIQSGTRSSEPTKPTPKKRKVAQKKANNEDDSEETEETMEEESKTPSRKKVKIAGKLALDATSDDDDMDDDTTSYLPSPPKSTITPSRAPQTPSKQITLQPPSRHLQTPSQPLPTSSRPLQTPSRTVQTPSPSKPRHAPSNPIQTPSRPAVPAEAARKALPDVIDLADSDEEENERAARTPKKVVPPKTPSKAMVKEVVIKTRAPSPALYTSASYYDDYDSDP